MIKFGILQDGRGRVLDIFILAETLLVDEREDDVNRATMAIMKAVSVSGRLPAEDDMPAPGLRIETLEVEGGAVLAFSQGAAQLAPLVQECLDEGKGSVLVGPEDSMTIAVEVFGERVTKTGVSLTCFFGSLSQDPGVALRRSRIASELALHLAECPPLTRCGRPQVYIVLLDFAPGTDALSSVAMAVAEHDAPPQPLLEAVLSAFEPQDQDYESAGNTSIAYYGGGWVWS